MLSGGVDLTIGLLPAALYVWSQDAITPWMPPPDLLAIEHIASHFHTTRTTVAWTWISLWLPLCGLHGLFGGLQRATPGAWLTGLRVVGPDGHTASTLRGVVRGVAYVTWPLTLLLAPMLCAVGGRQRGLHDLVSGTTVVLTPKPTR